MRPLCRAAERSLPLTERRFSQRRERLRRQPPSSCRPGEGLAPVVDRVLADQLERLRRRLPAGAP